MDYVALLKNEINKQIEYYKSFAENNECTSYWDEGYDYGRLESYNQMLDFVNNMEYYYIVD